MTRKACQVGCIACQKCVKVCKFEAITVDANLAYIDAEKCKLCRKCEEECPQSAIHAFNFPPRKPKPEAPAAPKPATPVAPKPEAPVAPKPEATVPVESSTVQIPQVEPAKEEPQA